jgi:hypothetical protein
MFYLVFLIPGLASGETKDYSSGIVQANGHYLNGEYEDAAQLYESMISQGLQNGYVYYNLGNTYIRLNKIGPAIYSFLKGRELLPRDEALKANLDYAIGETEDRISLPPAGLLHTFLFWVDDFTVEEHLNILLVINLLFWVVLTCWFIYRTGTWNTARKVTLGLLVLALVSTAGRFHLDNNAILGVILAHSVDVKSEFGKDSVTLFQLHEGGIVRVTDKNGVWVRIELSDGKKGWVPRDSIRSTSTH